MSEILEIAYEHARLVLSQCSTKWGFFASGGKDGYNAVWARDSMISSLGASLLPEFKDEFRKSIETLSKHQAKNGQIPNCVDIFANVKKHIDFQSIDSSLWYIIGHYIYMKRYKDKSLMRKYSHSIKQALIWLQCQDASNIGMLSQLPTSDWQDAFPHKYGHVINAQVLYHKILKLLGKHEQARKLKHLVNNDDEWGLWNDKFYMPYRWKNHDKYKEMGSWFDSLGNCLAIIFDFAGPKKSEKILRHIKRNGISKPYPIRAIYPVIRIGSKEWQDYFYSSGSTPYNYQNSGIWGYIGCFYVLALIKMKKFAEAEQELLKLAENNLRGNFPEWTNPKTKETFGKLQAWEAGMFILAYESLKKKRVLIF
jgi:hypothetical protein